VIERKCSEVLRLFRFFEMGVEIASMKKLKLHPSISSGGRMLIFTFLYRIIMEGEGLHAVAPLVEALRYKSEGRGFDSRWCYWNFSLT